MTGTPAPVLSPWTWDVIDNQVPPMHITIIINFDNTTRAVSGGSVFRDATCQWTHIYIGLGADGTPNTAPIQFTVPAGTTNLNKNQLNNNGITVIEDVLTLQITAGP